MLNEPREIDFGAVDEFSPQEDIDALVEHCWHNTYRFSYYFLKEWFTQNPSPQEMESWALMDDETIPWGGECCYRGWGKSTKLKAKAVAGFCYRTIKFWLHVKNDGELAAADTEVVRQELMSNALIVRAFGKMTAASYKGIDTRFSKKAWYLSDPKTGEPFAFCCPKGMRQYVRGINVRIGRRVVRPDFITADDYEDNKTIGSEELRRQAGDIFIDDILKTVDSFHSPDPKTNRWIPDPQNPHWTAPWRVWYVDTLKHSDALIAHLMVEPTWRIIKRPQSECRQMPDGSFEYFSCVPSIISDEQVRAEVAVAKRFGKLDGYAREKMCQPNATELASWNREMYRYYNEITDRTKINRGDGYDRIVIVDLAKTVNPRSAFTAMLAVAADAQVGRIYIRSLVRERMEKQAAIEKVFQVAAEFNCQVIAVEITGFEGYKFDFLNEASRRQLNVQFIWLSSRELPTGDFGTGRERAKRARASMVAPYYARGYVYHDLSLKDGALEIEQLAFPNSATWDALDTCGYIPKVLSEMGRFFMAAPDQVEELKFDTPYSKEEWNDAMTDRGGMLEMVW